MRGAKLQQTVTKNNNGGGGAFSQTECATGRTREPESRTQLKASCCGTCISASPCSPSSCCCCCWQRVMGCIRWEGVLLFYSHFRSPESLCISTVARELRSTLTQDIHINRQKFKDVSVILECLFVFREKERESERERKTVRWLSLTCKQLFFSLLHCCFPEPTFTQKCFFSGQLHILCIICSLK